MFREPSEKSASFPFINQASKPYSLSKNGQVLIENIHDIGLTTTCPKSKLIVNVLARLR